MEIHIGSIVKKVAFEKHIVKGDLAKSMGLHQGSISRIFNYPSIQTLMLKRFCEVLEYDFFAHYSEDLKLAMDKNGKTSCEKLLGESAVEIGNLKQEIVYLKQINGLLERKN